MLEGVPLLDQHAHNLLRWEHALASPYGASFTEGYHPRVEQELAPHTLFFRRSLRDVGELLECEATEPAVLARRSELGQQELAARCFSAANMEGLFLDDGLTPERILPLDWHARFVPVRRLLRLEVEAEGIMACEETFADFEDRLRSRLARPGQEVVGFKSIAAYRCGLNLVPPDRNSLRQRYAALKGKRLSDPEMVSLVVRIGLEQAAELGLPVQFHTGFGDPDLDLARANPLRLRPILEDLRYRGCAIVLLHAAYPYCRQAGYLASVYPNVWVDFGLAVPFLSVGGMRRCLAELLELTPLTRLLYSSDASRIPELYYLAARWARKTLSYALRGAVADGDLSGPEAEQAGEWILRGNARRLYRGQGL